MRKRILIGIFIFMMPMFVYADEILVSCPSEVTVNNEFTCTVSGKSDKIVTAISARINSANTTFISFTNAGGWMGDGNEGNVALYTAEDKTGIFDIGTIKFKSINVASSIVIENIIFYDEDGVSTGDINSVSKIVNIKNNVSNNQNSNNNNNNQDNDNQNDPDNVLNNSDNEDNNDDENINIDMDNKPYLIDLYISDYDLSFDSNVYEYSLNIGDEDKLEIIPTTLDSDYIYEIRNNNNLVNGSVIEVEVISKFNDSNSTVYKINIIKDDEKKDYSIVFIGIISILVIINVVRIVFNIRKKRNAYE